MSTAESGTEQDFKTQLIYPAGEGKKVLLKRPPYICQTVWPQGGGYVQSHHIGKLRSPPPPPSGISYLTVKCLKNAK
jgi:hypothetical protein